ncbi:putative lysine exporter protein LysE/YggA [Roseibium sp. TrichSKD4]|uniref:LysE family translocator n=1 Tax=Roseibium sp. TrichSKD4 TaxID=744980 RepID=UPI0001E5611B|nr:LysE family transporter [Roseibium sp. TrichSKD4]EFO34382.1 putative lysine exporter protein LysE/YggA [Roseibium sp. TrichSKD4]
MTLLEYALIGFVIGILTTAPVGPVNVMAIQHAAQQGIRNGLTVGLGAVLADVIYASVAVFGVSAVTTFLDSQFDLIRIVGGLVLILFGLKVFATHPHLISDTDGADTPAPKVGGDMAVAFFMVLTNPGAAFGFVAIMGALGEWRPAHGDHVGAAVMVIGVALGATSWWAGLSALVARFKDKINDAWLDRANRIAGTILICFGVAIYVDLVFGMV